MICCFVVDHDGECALFMYVMSYEEGIHEITLSQASDAKTANMMMAELEYAVPVLGSALEMELLTDQAGEYIIATCYKKKA